MRDGEPGPGSCNRTLGSEEARGIKGRGQEEAEVAARVAEVRQLRERGAQVRGLLVNVKPVIVGRQARVAWRDEGSGDAIALAAPVQVARRVSPRVPVGLALNVYPCPV